ncbi:unnamed protein product [Peniophora sp. CBMAI 1063]|nr:unnamed protein product [Peniophora sp. CBMAI 1063]
MVSTGKLGRRAHLSCSVAGACGVSLAGCKVASLFTSLRTFAENLTSLALPTGLLFTERRIPLSTDLIALFLYLLQDQHTRSRRRNNTAALSTLGENAESPELYKYSASACSHGGPIECNDNLKRDNMDRIFHECSLYCSYGRLMDERGTALDFAIDGFRASSFATATTFGVRISQFRRD